MLNIPNATITERIVNGKLLGYRITPNEGYVLHDKARDTDIIDEATLMPTGEILLGYIAHPTYCTVQAAYNFSDTVVIDGYTAYGSREFFTRPQSEVPENQIYGGGNNNHEVS